MSLYVAALTAQCQTFGSVFFIKQLCLRWHQVVICWVTRLSPFEVQQRRVRRDARGGPLWVRSEWTSVWTLSEDCYRTPYLFQHQGLPNSRSYSSCVPCSCDTSVGTVKQTSTVNLASCAPSDLYITSDLSLYIVFECNIWQQALLSHTRSKMSTSWKEQSTTQWLPELGGRADDWIRALL